MGPPVGVDRIVSLRSALRGLIVHGVLALGLGLDAARAAGLDSTEFNGFDVSNASVPALAIQRGGPPKDGIPAIDRPKFAGADLAQLTGDDRVLGVALGGRPAPTPCESSTGMKWSTTGSAIALSS